MTAIFSVKPKYWSLIIAGCKTVELRRTCPKQISSGCRVIFWECSPKKQLAGGARVVSVVTLPVEKLWDETHKYAGVTREEFDEYFAGKDVGVAVFLADAAEFSDKPTLSSLRDAVDFHPPRSFRYASPSEIEYLTDRGVPVHCDESCPITDEV